MFNCDNCRNFLFGSCTKENVLENSNGNYYDFCENWESRRKGSSQICFKDICVPPLSNFVKVVWNGKTIFEDKDDGPYFNGELAKITKTKSISDYWRIFVDEWQNKIIYSFTCNIVSFHHTEIYIQGE